MGSTGLKTGAGRGSGTNGRRLSGSTSLKIWKTSGNSSGFFGNGISTTSCRTIIGFWDNFQLKKLTRSYAFLKFLSNFSRKFCKP